jgi:hypothetical protein
MKYIEKSRIETFLKFKGYKAELDYNENEQNINTCWCKSEYEKVTVPKKEVLQSNDLPLILKDEELLKEFRKF